MWTSDSTRSRAEEVRVAVADEVLLADFVRPPGARGLILFAHGSGSGRHSPRNRFVAERLRAGSLATLLFDLLTPAEEAADLLGGRLRFDIPLLTERVIGALDWLSREPRTRDLVVGLYGASTGAAAALSAAAARPARVSALVSRGGRPDLAGEALAAVRAPTLLIVGGDDQLVLGLNRRAMTRLACPVRLEVIPGAGHLFEEPGALERVAELARGWFTSYLVGASP